jgi:type II secretory pathway pseudopilin PulG
MRHTVRNSGASLLEVIIAIGLVSVILMSLVSLSTKSVSNSTVSREKNQATRFTQETIEWLRQERDQSWTTFSDNVNRSNTWCLPENDWDIPGACSGQVIANTGFEREVSFNRPRADTIEVTVVTQWTESGNIHESRSATILTKWQ